MTTTNQDEMIRIQSNDISWYKENILTLPDDARACIKEISCGEEGFNILVPFDMIDISRPETDSDSDSK